MRFGAVLLPGSLFAVSGCFGGETVPFMQLNVGFNAPAGIPFRLYYANAEEVRQSWVASSLTEQQLASVLNEMDFDRQVLLAMAAGTRHNLTGTVSIQKIKVTNTSVTPYIHLGVNEEHCAEPEKESFPFVLLAIEWPKTKKLTLGIYHQNYPDGCKSTVGLPTTSP